MPRKFYYVYILHCDNDSYYTGYTTDVIRRFYEHRLGKGGKYTRSFKPLCLAQSWQIEGSRSHAMQVEKFIKNLSKAAKKRLICYPMELMKQFLAQKEPESVSL